MAIQLTPDADGFTFAVKVVPGALRDRIAGEYDGGLKIAVAKVAQDGQANRAVVDLLSRYLDLGKGQVEIIRGHANPRKVLRVRGIPLEQLQQRLSEANNSLPK